VTTRIITGLVLGALAIVVAAHGGLVLFFVVLALALLAVTEFYRLTRVYRPLPLAGFLGVALMLASAWFFSPTAFVGATAAGVLFTALLGLAVGPKRGVTVRMAVTALGMVYVGLGFGALLLLRPMDENGLILLTVIFGTWAGDTMAYFTGKAFGSTPMAPALSPKKTWEGFAGGVAGSLLVSALLAFALEYPPLPMLLLGLLCGVAGQLGDLGESILKREAGVKDSGRWIPGHGGFLDRFDSILVNASLAFLIFEVLAG